MRRQRINPCKSLHGSNALIRQSFTLISLRSSQGYEGRKGLGSLHSVIRKKLTSLSSGEKRRKAFIGLGGKYGVGWSRIADDVETFVEDFLNVNGYVGVWGDVSFWVGEERLKGIQGGLSVYMNGNAMNWKGFREGLEDCCKVQRR